MPAFTFIPTDLEYFIRFEEEDFARRQAIVAVQQREHEHELPQLPSRRCPTAADYLSAYVAKAPAWPSEAVGGPYSRYTIPGYPLRPKTQQQSQAWQGAPMAAIFHAFRAVLGNVTSADFVPASVWSQLRQLQDLYKRPLVPLRTGPEDGAAHQGEEEELHLPDTGTGSQAGRLEQSLTQAPSSPLPNQSSSAPRQSAVDQLVEVQAQDVQAWPIQKITEQQQALDSTALSELKQSSRKRRRNSLPSFSRQEPPNYQVERQTLGPDKQSVIEQVTSPKTQPPYFSSPSAAAAASRGLDPDQTAPSTAWPEHAPAHEPSVRPPERQRQGAQDEIKLHQPVSPTNISYELRLNHEPPRKRRCDSSSFSNPPARRKRTSPPSPTPALTHEASTISQHASPLHRQHSPQALAKPQKTGGMSSVNPKATKKDDRFAHVFCYHWKWGPQSSTQEKIQQYLQNGREDG